MSKLLEEISALSAAEKAVLLRVVARDIEARPDVDPAAAYRNVPPGDDEFSSYEDTLAWEADGWENIG